MGDPAVVPCVLVGLPTLPFTPGKQHTAALQNSYCSSGDHCWIRDWDSCIESKCLALLLFSCVDSKQKHCIDALVEVRHVGIVADVHDELANGDTI
jgi:hypothetical protein